MPTLAVIILTYNNSRHIANCLEGIFKFYMKELTEGKLELLVIDNKSSDETVRVAQEYLHKKNIYKLSTIQVVENTENRGFGSGLNTGVAQTKAPYVLFMNPDSELANDKLFDMKKLFEEHKKVGVVGGKIVNSQEKQELSAGKFLNLVSFMATNFGLERLSGGGVRFSPQKTQKVDYVSGGFMMVERAAFEEINGFDSNLFMYMEDMELCYRMHKKGYSVYFFPDAILKHEKHGSSNRSFAIVHIYKGTLYYFQKHKSKFDYFLVKFLLCLKALVLIGVGKITNNSYLTQTYEKSLKVC